MSKPTEQPETFELTLKIQITVDSEEVIRRQKLDPKVRAAAREAFIEEVGRKAMSEARNLWVSPQVAALQEVSQACSKKWRPGDSQGTLLSKVGDYFNEQIKSSLAENAGPRYVPPTENTIIKHIKTWLDNQNHEHSPPSSLLRRFKDPQTLNAYIELHLILHGGREGLKQLANASPIFTIILKKAFPDDLPASPVSTKAYSNWRAAMRPLDRAIIKCANTPQYTTLIAQLANHWPTPQA